jgi:hypothetical protein
LRHKIEINQTTLLTYLNYLHKSKLTNNLYLSSTGSYLLHGSKKHLLKNTNLAYASGSSVDIGNLRETSLQSLVSCTHSVILLPNADFIIDHTWTMEVGGKNKDLPDSHAIAYFTAVDEIALGLGKKIPL